ncbi:MAG: hypothetical protein USCAAHI_00232 [Beijerinckiaceae bacterium]|nr:MAG: hypothetical protein USCAAHI_00232 [Beijerinckiaceae bacterium]
MAHFPSLSDWRGILRWIATTLFALFIGTLAEENVRYVAEQEHWNEILMSGIRIMPDLHFYMETKGFWFFFGLTAGIAAACGLFGLSRRRSQNSLGVLMTLRSYSILQLSLLMKQS